jgi:uncharacterized protein YecE (DUF72 family)
MPRWRLGTMGFSYSEWSEVFYPRGTKQVDWLEFYAKHFDAVELDTTFHAVPPVERVRAWRDATPANFCFCVKTPKAITHDAGIRIDRAAGSMKQFLEVMRELQEKLGVVLLQLRPSLSRGEAPHLRKFLEAMPRDIRFAVEFRHDSWFVPDTIQLLRELRCCWVAADYAHEPRQLTPTTDFLYVRWIGVHQQFPTMDRLRADVTDRLTLWNQQIRQHVEQEHRQGRPINSVWGFFNNDYAGFAVATCEQFKRIVGLEVVQRRDERQGRLFA